MWSLLLTPNWCKYLKAVIKPPKKKSQQKNTTTSILGFSAAYDQDFQTLWLMMKMSAVKCRQPSCKTSFINAFDFSRGIRGFFLSKWYQSVQMFTCACNFGNPSYRNDVPIDIKFCFIHLRLYTRTTSTETKVFAMISVLVFQSRI